MRNVNLFMFEIPLDKNGKEAREEMNKTNPEQLKLKVAEALKKDVGRSYARMDPEDIKKIGGSIGDIVEITGKKTAVCKVMPAYMEQRRRSSVQLDGISRENAGCGIDETVLVHKTPCLGADTVTLVPINITPAKRDLNYIGSLLDGLPVIAGDRIQATLFGSRSAYFKVENTVPKGPVLINPTTRLMIGKSQAPAKETKSHIRYEDIGGLRHQVQRIREMIELPLRFPEVFERLGIDAPNGVLLYGPPGCGKTLIARAIAHETEANFFSVSGPEVVHKFYGESEAHLRKIFDEASRSGPSIVFLDEIDAIAPQREKVVGDVEKRVVAQLLALMDGLTRRHNLIVIAATNIPNALDPALRRPGRFDREIGIPIPDKHGRMEILDIHSRGMPLAKNVDMKHLAEITHGFVGADLEALCREAAMICLRRFLPDIDFNMTQIPYDQLKSLEIYMDDFRLALKEVEPSAIREVFVEVPNVKWKDIGGNEEIKKSLVEAVEWPINYPRLFEKAGVRPPKGILLSGPPGCGKTLLAKAIANESNVNFISVKGPELISKYVGESEKGVREIFRKARQASPCIVFFDEIDAMVVSRGSSGSDSSVAERVLSQFLSEFDGIDELKGVLILGATNRLDMLDAAVLRPGRFDEIVEIPLPAEKDRMQIFGVHLRKKPIVDEIDPAELAKLTEGLSGAEIEAICNRAALMAVRRAINDAEGEPNSNTGVKIQAADMKTAMEAMMTKGRF